MLQLAKLRAFQIILPCAGQEMASKSVILKAALSNEKDPDPDS